MAKRIFDIVSSALGLLVLAPLLLVVAILIKMSSPGPVFFRQERVGREDRLFSIYKFRTMRTDSERSGAQLTVGRDPRITNVGHFLRKAKIDELPQLINVLKGDMSIVGPRPEVPKYVALYTTEQRRVLQVRPGITDVASIAFRDENDLLAEYEDPESYYVHVIMPRKLALNIAYLEQRSFVSDIVVIFKTLWRILPRAEVKEIRVDNQSAIEGPEAE